MTRTRLRRRPPLGLEPLEGRDAPATLVGNTRVTYQDADGDNVTVTLSKPVLNAGNVNTVFTFDAGSVNGTNVTRQQLRLIDLNSFGTAATGTAVTVTAARSPVTGGDGFAAVGVLDATGIDLGLVTVDGDLGRTRAGDATPATPGLQGLTVHSLGRFGTSTGAPDLDTVVQGRLGSLNVKSDVREAFVDVQGGVDGRIGSVTIGGSLVGGAGIASGLIQSSGAMGVVRVGGSVRGGSGVSSGQIYSGGTLAGVTVGGSLVGGAGIASGRIDSTGPMGAVRVGGSVRGGGDFSSGLIFTISTLAGVTIGGSLVGGAGDLSGYIFSSGPMGAVRITGDLVGGSASGTASLTNSGYVQGKRIASFTLGGSLIAGTNDTTGTFRNNGAVRAEDDLGPVLINGSIVGNGTNPAIVSARGSAAPTATSDVAIGSLRVKGRVEFAQILAGVGVDGVARNADAQVGGVFVGGDWVASSLAAGVMAGPDGMFGTAADTKMAGAGVKDVPTVSSRIAGLTIGGQVVGTVGGADHFGTVAERVGAVTLNGTPLALTPGPDDIFVGITGDFRVREV